MSNNIPIAQGVVIADNNNNNNKQGYPSSSGNNNNPNYQGFANVLDSQQQQQQHGYVATATKYDQEQGNTGGDDSAHLLMNDHQAMRENPPRQFQDIFWAIFFYAHLAVMVGVISTGIANADLQTSSYSSIMSLVVVTGVVAVVLSIAALSFMMINTVTLVQVALIFNVISSGVVAILGFTSGDMLMGALGALSFLLGICYTRLVWRRIPYAAANLNTALSAIKDNMGLTVVAYTFMSVAFAWSFFWFLGLNSNLSQQQAIVVFVLFLSLYWTQQVLQNTVHVTTAGVVGTWWFVPSEARSCCSSALGDSLFRSLTYSFGSICFGSFVLAVVQALRATEYYLRDNRDMGFLVCIIQCFLACIEGIIDYFNRWAYVYVGLYGFNYMDAGRNVLQLFESKGWNVIITDDLCDNVLFMVSAAIGVASGLVGLIMGSMNAEMFQDAGFDSAAGPAFFIGLLVGFVLSSIVMSVVGSAVNTVIVCYAEAPAEFAQNHPELHQNMQEAWTQAWPELF